MAKITPSSLITAIQGKFNKDSFQLWKGAIVRRRTVLPVHQLTETRSRFKGLVSTFAGRWDALSQASKDAWDSLASQFPTSLSGFNVFMSCNVANVYPSHPSLCYYSTALTCYFLPPMPSFLSVSWLTAEAGFCVLWTTPSCLSHFVQTFMAMQSGYSNRKFPKLQLKSTTVSTALESFIDGSNIPAGVICQFRARTIDLYGMFSSYTNTVTCTVGG